MKSESGAYYVIHAKHHYIGDLNSLMGEKIYQEFLHPEQNRDLEKDDAKEFTKSISDLLYQLGRSSGGSGKDPMENEEKKRRKRKKK
jgi:hypothetical protein